MTRLPAARRRVLVVQPSIEPPGGGNAVACWMIEALKADHDVTLFTRRAPDLDLVNRTFGVTLTPGELAIRVAPPTLPVLSTLLRSVAGLALLRDHMFLAEARRLAGAFDVVVSAHNECDLGGKGVQYVHFPKFLADRPDLGRRFYQGPIPVRIYRALCATATGFSNQRMRANVTLANSEWTRRRLRELHGLEPIVLHPPVAGSFPAVPWSERPPSFACVGRIAPEKRLEEIIGILTRVRARHSSLTLHIVGNADHGPYLARVKAAARDAGSWVSLHIDATRAELVDVLTHCRYGIHGMLDEHFGMAVAELLSAGEVAFAPNSGGPVEILGGDPRLLYDSDDEAVNKIDAVLQDEALTNELRTTLGARAERYSSDRFVREFRAIVAGLTS